MVVIVTPTVPHLLSATLSGNNTLTLLFDRTVSAGSGNLVISDGHSQNYIGASGPATRIVGATDTRSLAIGSDSHIELNGSSVVIHLDPPLAPGADYSITMGAGVIAGFGGVASTSLFHFAEAAAAAPTAVLDNTISFIDTGVVGDHLTNALHQIVSGTYSGALGAHDFVQVSLDNGATWHQASASGGSWSYEGDIDTAWVSGASAMLARVANTEGMASATVSTAYTYNYVAAPTAVVNASSMALAVDTGVSNIDWITGVSQQSVLGTYTGTLGIGERIEVSADGVNWSTATVNTNTHVWGVGVTLSAGVHNLTARVVDSLGNYSAPAIRAYNYDNVSPTLTLAASTLSLAPGSDSGVLGDNITNHQMPTIVIGNMRGGHIDAGDLLQIVDTDHGNAVVGTYTVLPGDLDGNGGLLNNTYGVALTSPLAAGTHTLVARAADVAGHTAAVSAALTVDIVLEGPAVDGTVGVLMLKPENNSGVPDDALTNDTTPDFLVDLSGLTGLAAGFHVEVVDLGGLVVASKTLVAGDFENDALYGLEIPNASVLGEGTHGLSVRITDASGNAASHITTATLSLEIDTTGPLLTASDDGNQAAPVSGKFYVDFNETVLLTGMSVEFVSGGNVIAANTSLVGGQLELSPVSQLVAGSTYTVVINDGTIIDLAGNEFPGGGTLMTFHTAGTAPPAPTAVVDSAIAFYDDGVSGTDHITTSRYQNLSGTFTGTLNPGENIQVSLDSGAHWHVAVVNGQTWSYDGVLDTATLGGNSADPVDNEFSSSFMVRASNGAELHSATATQAYSYDHLIAHPTDIKLSDDTGISDSDMVTSVAAQTITGHYTGVLNPGDVLEVSIDGGVSFTPVAASDGQWTLSATLGQLGSNTGSVSVRISDAAGNSDYLTESYRLYTSAVSLADRVMTLTAASDNGPNDHDGITNTLPSVRIPVSGLTGFHIGDRVEIFDSVSQQVVGHYEISYSDLYYGQDHLALPALSFQLDSAKFSHDASYSLTAKITDLAGNVGAATVTPLAVTLDTVAPTASGQLQHLTLNGDSDRGVQGDNLTSLTTPSFTVDLSGVGGLAAGDTVQVFDTDHPAKVIASVTLGSADLDGTGHLLNPTVLAANVASMGAASYTMSARVVDLAGNLAAGVGGTSYAFTLDLAPPQVTGFNNNNGAAPVSGDLVLTFNEAVAVSGAAPVFTFNSGDHHTTATYTVSGNQLTLHLSGSLEFDSEYTITLAGGSLTDSSGNIAFGVDGSPDPLTTFYTIPTPPPAATVNAELHFLESGASDSDFVTNIRYQTVTGTVTGALAGDDFVEISMDNGNTWAHATVSANTWSYSGQVDPGQVGDNGNVEISSTMIVRVSNSVTGLSSAQVTQNYVYDHVATQLGGVGFSSDTGSSTTDLITNVAAQTITGQYSGTLGAGDKIEISFGNSGTWNEVSASNGSWSWNTTLTGSGTFHVRATDLAGNTVTTDHNYEYIAGAVSLAARAPTLKATTDSGPNATDGITNLVPTVVLDMSGLTGLKAGNVIEVYDTLGQQVVGHYTVIGSNIPYGNGLFYPISLNIALDSPTVDHEKDGTYSLVARVKDIAGNIGAASTTALAVTIDTTEPLLTASDNGHTTVPVSGDLVLTFNEPVNLDLNATLTLTSGGTTIAASSTINGNQLTVHPASDMLPNSNYTLNLTGGNLTDMAGNIAYGVGVGGNPPMIAFHTGGIAAPSATVDGALHFLDTGASATDFVTSISEQTVTGTFTGTLGGNDVIEISMDNGDNWHTATVSGNGWSYTGSVDPAQLPYQDVEFGSTIIARVHNGVTGLSSTAVTQAYTYDHRATALSNTMTFSADSGTHADDLVTNIAAQTIGGTYFAPFNAGDKIAVSLDGGTTWLDAAAADGTWSVNATLTGSGTIDVRATDLAGNVAEASKDYKFITSATSLNAKSPTLDSTTDSGDSDSDGVTGVQPLLHLSVAGLASFNIGDTIQIFDTDLQQVVGHYNITSSNIPYGNGLVYPNSLNITLDSTLVDHAHDGVHHLVARVADVAGNIGTASATPLAITIDTSPPVLGAIALSPDTGYDIHDGITNTLPQFLSGSYSGTVGAGDSIRVVVYDGVNLDGASVDATIDTASRTWSANVGALFTHPDPTHSYSVEVHVPRDPGGAVSATILVDTEAPVHTLYNAPTPTLSDYAGPDIPSHSAAVRIDLSGIPLAVGDVIELVEVNDNNAVLSHVKLTSAYFDGGNLVNVLLELTASGLGEGSHDLAFRVADLAGNYTGNSPMLTVTVDTTAPTASLAEVTIALAAASSNSDTHNTTELLRPTFDIDLSSASGLEAGDILVLLDVNHNTRVGSYTITASDVANYGITDTYIVSILADDGAFTEDYGSHALRAQIEDAAGNVSTGPTSDQAVIGLTPSVHGAAVVLKASSDSGTAGDNLTNIAEPVVTADLTSLAHLQAGDVINIVDASHAGQVVGHYQVQLADLGAGGTLLQPLLDIHLTDHDALADGPHQLAVQYQQNATGFLSKTSDTPLALTIDTTPSAGYLLPSATSFPDTTASQTITGQYSVGSGLGDEFVQVSLDGNTWVNATTTSISGGIGHWSVTGSTANGLIEVRLSDSAGNLSTYPNSGSTVIVMTSDNSFTFSPPNGNIAPIFTGAGNDRFDLPEPTHNILSGGAGTDTVNTYFSNGLLPLNKFFGINIINLSPTADYSGNSIAAITPAQVLAMTDLYAGVHKLQIVGNALASVSLGLGWETDNPTENSGYHTYHATSDNNIVLLVGNDLSELLSS